MKKQILISCFVVVVLLVSNWYVTQAQQDCAPPGTVYREGCPREVLVSSSCQGCDPSMSLRRSATSIRAKPKTSNGRTKPSRFSGQAREVSQVLNGRVIFRLIVAKLTVGLSSCHRSLAQPLGPRQSLSKQFHVLCSVMISLSVLISLVVHAPMPIKIPSLHQEPAQAAEGQAVLMLPRIARAG